MFFINLAAGTLYMYFENECTVVAFFIRGWSTYAKGLIVKKYSNNTVKMMDFNLVINLLNTR